VLDHATRITGTVRDERGEPVRQGYVFFDDPDDRSSAFSVFIDAHGAYRALDLPPGNYYVSARRFSKEANQVVGDKWYFLGVNDEALASRVAVSAGSSTVIDILFGTPRPAAGVFRVRSEEGMPVARAEVAIVTRRDDEHARAFPASVWSHHDLLRTNADGVAEVRELPPGDYYAFLSKLPVPLASWRNSAADASSFEYYAKPFSVFAGGAQVVIDFVVTAGNTLPGRFLMRNGAAPPLGHSISVALASAPHLAVSFNVQPTNLDHDDFLFEGLTANEAYRLQQFHGDPLMRFVIVGLRMHGTSLEDGNITVSSGGEVLDIILDRSAAVTGRVTGARGRQSATAKRIAGDVLPALHVETINTEVAGGRFSFRGLPPGTYVISVEGRAGSQTIELKAGSAVELLF
jgi:hypothetical protein